MSVYLSSYLPIPICLSICLSVRLPVYQSIYLPRSLSAYLTIFPSTFCPSVYVPNELTIYLSNKQRMSLSLSLSPSFCLSACVISLALYFALNRFLCFEFSHSLSPSTSVSRFSSQFLCFHVQAHTIFSACRYLMRAVTQQRMWRACAETVVNINTSVVVLHLCSFGFY